jgi:outer membrane protein TolC
MHLFGKSVFEKQDVEAAGRKSQPAGNRLRAVAALMLALMTALPSGFAQQAAATVSDKAASELPAAPAPAQTEPLNLRQSSRDFSVPSGTLLGNPINKYRPTSISKASFANSVRLTDLVKDGKIYLSLSDALALALENNYDIAIARYYMDIADTDILRAKAGSGLRGVGATVLQNTQGGSSQTLAASGAPGGTASGATTGTNGVVLTTDGVGPAPENLDPVLTSALTFERSESPQTSQFQPRAFQNTDSYNFTYNQGFITGGSLAVTFNNSHISSSSPFNDYSPELLSSFRATVTQNLLQGAGFWVNQRFIYEAKLDRRITDSTFRQQILYTVNQVENIYWALVSSYEDVQAKQHALEQSSKLLEDNKKQLEIGTLAPLDVVNAQSTVASDQQALLSSKNNLSYQQLILKQAIARNLNDAALVAAEVIPTDRVSLEQIPEEKRPVEDLVQEAFQNRPELEQAALAIKKDEITLKGARNALLPTLSVNAFYGASAAGGAQSPYCVNFATGQPCLPNTYPSVSYGSTFNGLFDSSSPDKGVGFNLNIPLRNRAAQADQARSLIEYRQAELHLEQLYTQIHMQVVSQQIALANDRALVQAAIASRDYNQQSLDAEVKKLRLGASTTANVLQQQRNLSSAENSLIAAQATYAQARAAMYQMLASTLHHYGINLNEAASGNVNSAPVVPGLTPAKSASN